MKNSVHPKFTSFSVETLIPAFDFTLSRKDKFLVHPDSALSIKATATKSIKHLRPLICAEPRKAEALVCEQAMMTAEFAKANGYGYLSADYNGVRKGWHKISEMNFAGCANKFAYHTNLSLDLSAQDDTLLVGFEVEKEDNIIVNEKSALENFARTGWKIERDGSLDHVTGYEMVSPTIPANDKEVLKKTLSALPHLINASVSNRCGGHINLSINGLTPLQVAEKFRHAIHLIYAMYPSREYNTFCHAYSFDHMMATGDKYQAIRLHNNRIEFRTFPKAASIDTIMWRIELLEIMTSNQISGVWGYRATKQQKSLTTIIALAISKTTPIGKHLRKVYNELSLQAMLYRAVEMAAKYGNYRPAELKHMRARISKMG